MTLKQATTIVKELGLSLTKTDGEYRVRIPGQPEADYYTSELDDAIDTARAMAADAAKRLRAERGRREWKRAAIMQDTRFAEWARSLAASQCGDGEVLHVCGDDCYYVIRDADETGLDIFYAYNSEAGIFDCFATLAERYR